jgi:hypothetical protein
MNPSNKPGPPQNSFATAEQSRILSTMTRGSLPLDKHIDPHKLVERLADALRLVHAKDVIVTANRISFSGGIFRFVSNWNVLVPFSQGELIIDQVAGQLQYRVSLRQFVMILIVFSVFFLIYILALAGPLALIPVALAMTWLLGGLNLLIAKARFEYFLCKTIDATALPTGEQDW